MEEQFSSSLTGSDNRFLQDFECVICAEDMSKKQCVLIPACGHCFCRECLQQWEADKIKRNEEVTCPTCRGNIDVYHPMEWPRFIRTLPEDIAAKMSALEREKAMALRQRRDLEQQLEKKEQLQQTLDEFRARQEKTLAQNEDSIEKLRKQISQMERERAAAQQDDRINKEKLREISVAKERMANLEGEQSQLRVELQRRQDECENLQRAVAEAQARLQQREQELVRLEMQQQQEVVAANSQPMSHLAMTAWPSLVASYATESSYYVYKGVKYLHKHWWASPAWSRGGSALVRKALSFRVLERRGTHGGSPVHRVVDTERNQAECVIKWRRDNSNVVDAFREAVILHGLSHDCIIPLLGVIDDDNQGVGLVMPFIEDDLEYLLSPDNVEGRKLDVRLQGIVVKSLLGALSYAHAQQVVHRNVSPSVVLLDANNIRLAGWTEASSLVVPELPPLVCRNGVRYQSPEYVLGALTDWKAFDMWAVGCIMWELMLESNAAPLIATDSRDMREKLRSLLMWEELRRDATAWLAKQEQGKFPVLEQVLREPLNVPIKSMVGFLQDGRIISPDGVELCMKMLSWDPTKRITAYNALVDKFLANTPEPSSGRDVPDPRAFSPAGVKEWVDQYVRK